MSKARFTVWFVVVIILTMALVFAVVSIGQAHNGSHPHYRGRGSCRCGMCQRIYHRSHGANHGQRSAVHLAIAPSRVAGSSPVVTTIPTAPVRDPYPVPVAVFADAVPTPHGAVLIMLELAGGDLDGLTVIDPGCGDGRLLIGAVRAGAIRAIGYEINPTAAAQARRRVADAGLSGRIRIWTIDARRADFSDADVVLVYLFSDLLAELRPKLAGRRVVSYAHEVPGLDCQRHEIEGHTFYTVRK